MGDSVSVLRHIVIQSEQHHPHRQGEHAGQETVEDQVEQQDEGWRKLETQKQQNEKGDIMKERVKRERSATALATHTGLDKCLLVFVIFTPGEKLHLSVLFL